MENPLAAYLHRHGVSQAKFAERGGWRQATVSGWCNSVLPSIPLALEIERVSDGEVTVGAWATFASESGKPFGDNTRSRNASQAAPVEKSSGEAA